MPLDEVSEPVDAMVRLPAAVSSRAFGTTRLWSTLNAPEAAIETPVPAFGVSTPPGVENTRSVADMPPAALASPEATDDSAVSAVTTSSVPAVRLRFCTEPIAPWT